VAKPSKTCEAPPDALKAQQILARGQSPGNRISFIPKIIKFENQLKKS